MTKIDARTPRVPITISGYDFTCPQPFTAGHVLSEGEAEALNAVFADRVRTNCVRQVNDTIASGFYSFPELQITLDTYAERYSFSSRADPIRRRAIDLAKAYLIARSKADGVAISPQDLRSLAETLISNGRYPRFVEAAKQQIELEREVAESELASD